MSIVRTDHDHLLVPLTDVWEWRCLDCGRLFAWRELTDSLYLVGLESEVIEVKGPTFFRFKSVSDGKEYAKLMNRPVRFFVDGRFIVVAPSGSVDDQTDRFAKFGMVPDVSDELVQMEIPGGKK